MGAACWAEADAGATARTRKARIAVARATTAAAASDGVAKVVEREERNGITSGTPVR
jgi:hypothetical protein